VWRDVVINRPDRFFDDAAFEDAKTANGLFARSVGGDNDVMRVRLGGAGNVVPAWISIRTGMRVVEHERLFATLLHLFPEAELFERIEAEGFGRLRSIAHRDQPHGAIRANRAGNDAAGFEWVVLPGLRQHGVDEFGENNKHLILLRSIAWQRGINFFDPRENAAI